MIIVKVSGGLGNQLFQYATGRALAELHKTDLLLDVSAYHDGEEQRPEEFKSFSRQFKLSSFNILAEIASQGQIGILKDEYCGTSLRDKLIQQMRRVFPGFLWKSSHIIESQYRYQTEVKQLPDNVYLQGGWQSHKYFDAISQLIRQELELTDKTIITSANNFISKLKNRHAQVIALHVRRGDLAHAQAIGKSRSLVHTIPLDMTYFERAMSEFPPPACFLIFSDTPTDIEWCRENLKGRNMAFSSADSDLWDFVAMQSCDHNIIAHSTFSWWAAWLNKKPGRRVIAPAQWSFQDIRCPMAIDDLLPPEWSVFPCA